MIIARTTRRSSARPVSRRPAGSMLWKSAACPALVVELGEVRPRGPGRRAGGRRSASGARAQPRSIHVSPASETRTSKRLRPGLFSGNPADGPLRRSGTRPARRRRGLRQHCAGWGGGTRRPPRARARSGIGDFGPCGTIKQPGFHAGNRSPPPRAAGNVAFLSLPRRGMMSNRATKG